MRTFDELEKAIARAREERHEKDCEKRGRMMLKSKCMWCVSGIVYDERTGKRIGSCFCDIDAYDSDVGCNDSCHYYQKKTEKEANNANA